MDCNRGNKFLLSDGRKSDTISIAQGQGCEDLVQVRRFSKHGKIFVFVAHGPVSLAGAIPASTKKNGYGRASGGHLLSAIHLTCWCGCFDTTFEKHALQC